MSKKEKKKRKRRRIKDLTSHSQKSLMVKAKLSSLIDVSSDIPKGK